jgi:hypothetical protein
VFALPASGAQGQAPKGHFAPSKQASHEEQAQQQIQKALYSQGTILNLPLNVQTEVRQAEGQDEDIAIQAQLDVSSLAFQKQGDRNVDSIVLAVALFDPDGKHVTGSQQRCNLSLADAARTEMEKRGFSLKTHVFAKPGLYTVRVVVRDSEGAKIAALSRTVEVPSQISPPAAQQITTPEPGGVVSGRQGGKAAAGGRATTAPSPVAAPTEQLIAPPGQGARDSQIRQLPTLNQATDITSLILPPLPSKLTAGSDEAYFEAYRIAEPITEWPLEKVRHRIPELKGLKPATATDQSQLAEILRGVSANVEEFVVNFTDTTALETIDEAQQDPGEYAALRGRSQAAKTITQKFRYLMLAQREGGGFSLVEYRTDPGGRERNPQAQTGFLKTTGFAALPLFFGPAEQPLSDFRYLGRQTVGGVSTEVVAFAEHPEPVAVLCRFNIGQDSIPILLQGVAWIRTGDHQIVKMRTDMLASLPRLKVATTVVLFRETRFQESPTALWLPNDVKVEAKLGRYVFSDHHRYSDYRMFRVKSVIKTDASEAAPR